MIRSVLFDTETTGLEPQRGDRVLEIAAVELINDLPTGRHFHSLIDPERDVPDEVVRIHGITSAMVRGQKLFAEIVEDLLAFFGDGMLVAHNAPFDFGFLNAELARVRRQALHPDRMVDTLVMAKTRFPGLPNSLDALCRRFGIDLSERTSHNALLDCRLLSDVYVELTGGRQRGLLLTEAGDRALPIITYQASGPRTPILIEPSEAELLAHAAFLSRLRDPIWLRGPVGWSRSTASSS